MKRFVAACILITAVALGLTYQMSAKVLHSTARADTLTAERDAALHTVDTMKARRAEEEIRWAAQTDSLRGVIARAVSRIGHVSVVRDTAFIPVQTYVYLRDSLIPECERCAARTDSLIRNAALTDAAWTRLVDTERSRANYHEADAKAVRRKRSWESKLWPITTVLGAIIGWKMHASLSRP